MGDASAKLHPDLSGNLNMASLPLLTGHTISNTRTIAAASVQPSALSRGLNLGDDKLPPAGIDSGLSALLPGLGIIFGFLLSHLVFPETVLVSLLTLARLEILVFGVRD